MPRRLVQLAACAALTGIAACKGGPDSVPPPTAPAALEPPPSVKATPPPPPPEWTRGAWPEHLPAESFVAAVATSTDAEAAEAAAVAALQVRLLGPAERRPFTSMPAALQPLVDPSLTRRYAGPERTSVLVAARRKKVISALDAWAAALAPVAPLPGGLGSRLAAGAREDPRAYIDRLVSHARHRRAAAFACEQAPVRTSTCAAPNPEPVQRALTEVLEAVAVTTEPPKGVPHHPRTGALRPVRVRVTWAPSGAAPKPLADMPVLLDLWGVPTQARTAADGGASAPVPPQARPAEAAVARLDAAALLGELVDLWPDPPAVQVNLRALTPARMRAGLSVKETSAGRTTLDGTERLREALVRAGVGAAFYLDERQALQLPAPAAAISALADAAQGDLDVLVIGQIESHFASQMGARSVWYEATGHVELFDAWTGQRIVTLDEAARAVAIGEAAAARAALQTLGEQLAEKLHDALVAYAPPAMAQLP